MRRSNRADRRHHNARMKRKARRLYPHDEKGTLSDHLASCSCYMCGNPRKYFGERTLQERREVSRVFQF
ncbi:hypothetical protein E1297_01780 [Roseibium sp. RKSG952]|nr:hypothetical protein [Roseibium sp. RKSG952]